MSQDQLLLISRKKAVSLGLKTYFTGKQCKRGHVAERWVSDFQCYECKKEASRESVRVWRTNHPERHAESRAKSYEKHKDRINGERRAKYRESPKEKMAAARRYYEDNKEKVLASVRKYRETVREQIRDKGRIYYRKNRLDRIAESRNQRARRKAAEGKHSKEDVYRLFSLQKGRCAICKSKLDKYHVDHIVPLAKGGSNYPENIQITCPACNMKKSSKDPIDFMQEVGFLI